MFFASGIWRVADVSSVSPSSEQTYILVFEIFVGRFTYRLINDVNPTNVPL